MTEPLAPDTLDPTRATVGSSDEALLAVVKRSGDETTFDAEKIRSAIARAGRATGEFDELEAELLTRQAMKVLVHRFATHAPHSE